MNAGSPGVEGCALRIDGAYRNGTDTRTDRPGRAWAMLAAGLVGGLIGMHVSVVRPMRHELDGMRREVVAVRTDLDGLVGRRDQVWETNTLLSGLTEQAAEVEASKAALETLRKFRGDVEGEGKKALEALAAVDMLSALQQSLLENKAATEAAAAELARVVELEKALVASEAGSASAREAADRLVRMQQTLLAQSERTAAAEYAMRRMIGTQERLAAEGEKAKAAADAVAAMAGTQEAVIAGGANAGEATRVAKDLGLLAETVMSSADEVYVARDVAEQLSSLRDDLLFDAKPAETAEAFRTADALFELRDLLGSDSAKVQTARANLDILMGMGTDLAAQTQGIVDAVQSLELLGDLRTEIADHIRTMEGVRRELIEIAVMESAVARAVKVIEPLAKLGDLRRLSEDEVRAAARTILDDRAARTAQGVEPVQTAAEPVPAPR